MVTVLQNCLAVLIARLLNAGLRGQITVRALVSCPWCWGDGQWPDVVRDVQPAPGGHNVLSELGHPSQLAGQPATALYAVIWVQIWANLGFSMMIYLAGMQAIPGDVYEAGKLDGTTPWSAFQHLTVPLLAPSITINVLLAIIGTITGFELIFVLTDGGPAFTTQTLGMWVFNQAFFSNNRLPGYASAIAMVQFLLVFAIALVMQYYLRRRRPCCDP
jgi:raffinose/stachyose/melibiose transport system permease protein